MLSEDKDGMVDVELARVAIANRVRPSAKTSRAIESPPAQSAPIAGQDDAGQSHGISYHVAKTIRETAEARIAQLKLAEIKGDLVRVAMVNAALANACITMREALLNMPARLAPQLAAESDTAAIQTLLHAELHSALTNLAESFSKLADHRESES